MTLTRDTILAELPRLRRYARVLTGDASAVDDLVVDTLECAWSRQHFRGPRTGLGMSLIALMREMHAGRPSCLGRGGEPTREAVAEDRAVGAMGSVPPTVLGPGAQTSLLAQFDRLPLDQREVLALVAVERLSYADIAGLLGVSVSTVLVTLARAREALRSTTVQAPALPVRAPNQQSPGSGAPAKSTDGSSDPA
jgi:RNA polymerase sigma-70 factor (ECF subfamily)